jgi:hypothetical protein
LAEDAGLSLATVSNFLTGKPVDDASFVELCHRLVLNCEEIAQLDDAVRLDEKAKARIANKHQDWGEASNVSVFYECTQELKTLALSRFRLITTIIKQIFE